MLLANGVNSQFISITRFSYQAFNDLLKKNSQLAGSTSQYHADSQHLPQHIGKRWLQPCDIIGLVLIFFAHSSPQRLLGLIFGLTDGEISKCLKLGISCLNKTLNNIECSLPRLPDDEEIQQLSQHLNNVYPGIKNTIGFLDGKRFPIKNHPSTTYQSKHYNTYFGSTNITCLL